MNTVLNTGQAREFALQILIDALNQRGYIYPEGKYIFGYDDGDWLFIDHATHYSAIFDDAEALAKHLLTVAPLPAWCEEDQVLYPPQVTKDVLHLYLDMASEQMLVVVMPQVDYFMASQEWAKQAFERAKSDLMSFADNAITAMVTRQSAYDYLADAIYSHYLSQTSNQSQGL